MRPLFRPAFRLIVALLCSGVLTACNGGNEPAAMYRNYIARLGNVTGFEPRVSEALEEIPPYPRARDLATPEEEVRVGFLTYFALGECQLLQQVSERNSSLGRVQAASGRLLYEMRFFQQLSACESAVRRSRPEDRDFLDALASIRRAKEANLPRTFWNATFASLEFRTLLSTGAPALQRNETLSLGDVEAALGVLTHLGRNLLERPPDLDLAALEGQYYHLQAGKPVGKLVHGLHLSRHFLAQATEILRQTAEANRLCPMGNKTPRGGYLFNVLVTFYAGEVQPYISALHRQSAPLLAKLHRLRQVETVEPPGAFVDFYDRWLNPESADGLWLNFDRAVKEHTQAWQRVLQQCAMMPQGPGDLR